MKEINGYLLTTELRTTNSGFSKWGFASRNGENYFIKEFIDPIYPVYDDVLTPAMVEHKKRICLQYEARSKLLYKEINACSDGNLVQIVDFFRTGSHYYLVMEKIQSISLDEVQRLSEQDKIRICKALIHSLGKLHQKGIVHADVKLDNILFRRVASGKVSGKLIDFDNSFWEAQPPSPEEEICGDPVYMAPETFVMIQSETGKINRAIDVFALGLVLHQIFSGDIPYFNHEKYSYAFEAILDGSELIYSRGIPEEWRNLIKSMTERDWNKRPTLEEAERIWESFGGEYRDVKEQNTGRGFTSTLGKGDTRTNPQKSKDHSFFTPAGDL